MKKNIRSTPVIIAMIAVLVIVGVVSSFLFSSSIAKKQKELDIKASQCTDLANENAELSSLLASEDEDELYEHFAREHNFVYPGEKVYYDVTPQ